MGIDWRSVPRRLSIVLGSRPTTLLVCAALLVVASVALLWLGSRATTAWRRSVEQLVERRASEKVALLSAALNQDMRGALTRVLVPITEAHLAAETPYDLSALFARAFARFPYPESFFAWRSDDVPDGDDTFVFTRADRPPAWVGTAVARGSYPVVTWTTSGALAPVLEQLRAHAVQRSRFVVIDATLGGEPHQVVAHLMYRGTGNGLFGIAGFTVSLPWVRDHYFDELTRQVSSIGGSPDDLSLAILDEAGAVITATTPRRGTLVRTRAFPLVFVDPALLSRVPGGRRPFPQWTAEVRASGEGALAAAGVGAQRLFALIALAVAATLAALLLTTVAVRSHAQLATMKSEFVSAVTHELKTPLSAIRLVADTLAQGRYESPRTVTDYAGLLGKESMRLGRLIDNLLAYARINDVGRFYTFEPVHLADVIDDTLDGMHDRLVELQFDVQVDVEPDLPPIRADRRAWLQVVDNLVDNAVKYSGSRRVLGISARAAGTDVVLRVADRGPGIPADEQPRVFDKFYRGRAVRAGGSGLGLTIAARIVHAHGGSIGLESTAGEGTTVTVTVPFVGRAS